MNKIKYKRKREFTKLLGVPAVYMDKRKDYLHCKFDLSRVRQLTNGEQQVRELAEMFGYDWGFSLSFYGPRYIYVHIPYDKEEPQCQ